MIPRKALVIRVARFGRPVGAEFGRQVGFSVLACERSTADDHPLRKASDRFGAPEQLREFEIIGKLIAAAQHYPADAGRGSHEKAAAAQLLLRISHVLLQCHTSR